MNTQITLTPTQRLAADGLLRDIPLGDVFVLKSANGMGRSAVLREVHAIAGGALVNVREFMNMLMARKPAAIEEALLDAIEQALASHDVVIVDDLHLVTSIVENHWYPRRHLLDAALTAMLGEAGAGRKKIVFGVDHDDAPWPIRRRAYLWELDKFTAADYECICNAYLPTEAARMDYAKIHRFAPNLNAHQLKNACLRQRCEGRLATDSFIAYLRSQNMASNVEIKEVRPVDWTDLKGVDDVIQALEAKIALPFENDALAHELQLKPKRGVLLAGPPGTGKTTIGRALAHRLKSKFSLIDGTMIAGTGEFHDQVEEVFEAAKQNAPSVVFIDDADVILERDQEHGFYRYLLTMLDGLESASAEHVCVMMTAMDVRSLPQAILRSGRVELWLETRLPDAAARAAIVGEKLSRLPQPLAAVDIAVLASATRGLTGADLKAAVEDGKLLFAHDKASGKPLRPAEEYFLEAIQTVRANRRNYARSRPARLTDVLTMGFSAE